MNKINVLYHDKKVGTIAFIDGKYCFQYADEWINNGFSISPLSLPLKKELFIPKKSYFDGLFGVFYDSLPDSWGRLLMNRYLKKKGIKNIDSLYMLSCVGKEGMGALEYIPSNNEEYNEVIDLDYYQDLANKVLDNEEVDITTFYKLAGSSGGARPKLLANIDGVDWIIKFQSKYDIDNAGLVEYEYALACKKIGINMPNFKLFNSKTNKGYFGIERFDRVNSRKIHMISVSALLEVDFNTPSIDYNDLFKLTKFLTINNNEDINQLFYRMCFNVYAHNLDDHTKNFSYIYDENLKRYKLSPAYDMTFSNTYYGEHTTSVNNKGKDITDDDLLTVGIKAGIKKDEALKMLNKVTEVVNKDLIKYLK
ncbi:MAG: type II toxin-antitoxin system HipA family toxin [Bacilli bacterium]|nr:type II toxin-antitoxin system HipA family toxin [Bacilli bacterium]